MLGHDKAACDASKSCATPSLTSNTTSPALTELTQQPIEEESDVSISLIPSIVSVILTFGLPDYIRPHHITFRSRSHIDFKVDAQPSYFPENTCFCH